MINKIITAIRILALKMICKILLPRGVWVGNHLGAYTCEYRITFGKLDKTGVLQGLSEKEFRDYDR